jgi:hypothetical protein
MPFIPRSETLIGSNESVIHSGLVFLLEGEEIPYPAM